MNAAPQAFDTPVRNGEDDLRAGRRVLETEADGLRALAASLEDSFINALNRLAAVPGRVIVTGMGKSGHIGRKIAATLASTGTPSFFVHPGEASHGDLGMITQSDGVLALSNSGETPELSDVIAHTRRIGIPLVGLTGQAPSSLSETADVTLLIPPIAEACPLGLAPTTSTTAALALGDALAVALLERKRFTSADFQQLHPGGQLGRRLLTVADVMHTGGELPTVTGDQVMADALIVMSERGFGCVGVVSETGRLRGIITDGDLRRHMNAHLLGDKTADIMTRDPVTIAPRALASEALGIMNSKNITNLFVVDDGKPVGVIHVHDCLRAGIA